jgi:hypothetical protein
MLIGRGRRISGAGGLTSMRRQLDVTANRFPLDRKKFVAFGLNRNGRMVASIVYRRLNVPL